MGGGDYFLKMGGGDYFPKLQTWPYTYPESEIMVVKPKIP